jgi:hypothetical protein
MVEPPVCGDGIKNGTEVCDGADHDGQACEDFLGFTGGKLGCTNCLWDLSMCEGDNTRTCGNGMLDEGEQCDGDDLGGATCENSGPAGYSGGMLACNENGCFIDYSGCCKPDLSLCSMDVECCSGLCGVLNCSDLG